MYSYFIQYYSTLYWSDIGNSQKIGRVSMDGGGNSVVFTNDHSDNYFKLAFTLDRSEQALYWLNATRSRQCYLQRSNIDGFNQSVVYNATNYRGGCSRFYSYSYYTIPLAIDFYGGAVYTYSTYSRYYVYITNTTRRTHSNLNYMPYTCRGYRSFQGIKVVSHQRQLQSKYSIHNNNSVADMHDYNIMCLFYL